MLSHFFINQKQKCNYPGLMPTLAFYKAMASIAARKYTLRYKGGALSLAFEALQSRRPKKIWLFLKFNWSNGRACFFFLHSSISTNLLTSYLSADFCGFPW